MRRIPVALLLALAACPKPPPAVVDAGPPPVISQDILVRPVVTHRARVQHVLIGWGDLSAVYRGAMDERAKLRTQAGAEDVVRSVLQRVKEGESFEQLMSEYSEDLRSSHNGSSYEVLPDGKLQPGFQALSLRLNVGEVGVCRSEFGYHIIKRVE
ncbi:MAG: peptidylprolyl isomerase [Deltaproteobacteria bacterium]|nr:peptidylprolyl isomerase [Deltaproteobacteria bacterium]